MPAPISETFRGNATSNNIMAAPSRLNSLPYNGTLTVEVSASACDASNFALLTIQQENGEVPIDGQAILFNGYDDGADLLHDMTEQTFVFAVPQGGHFNIDISVTGTVRWVVRTTLS